MSTRARSGFPSQPNRGPGNAPATTVPAAPIDTLDRGCRPVQGIRRTAATRSELHAAAKGAPWAAGSQQGHDPLGDVADDRFLLGQGWQQDDLVEAGVVERLDPADELVGGPHEA